MASKWRNSESNINTGNGNLNLDKGIYSNKAQDKIRFKLRTENGNPAGRKYYDKETGEILDSKPQMRAYELGEEEVTLSRDEINHLKEVAYSSEGWNIQRVIDEEEIELARLCKEAKQVKPNDDAVTNMEYIWNGLMETNKALIVKHAPDRNEHLYVVYANEDGLHQQRYLYPQEYETVEREVERLEGDTREMTAELIEKIRENHDTDEIVNNQREKLEEAIEKKMAGEELDIKTEEEQKQEEELEALL